jgi:hypothetical protein
VYPRQDSYLEFKRMCQAIANEGSILSLLPENLRKQLAKHGLPCAICEVAGRDSAAAVIRAFQQGLVTHILPIAVDIPVLYGTGDYVRDHVDFVRRRVSEDFNGIVYDPIVVGDVEFWRLLNARYVQELIQRFGFYSPCLGCHLYIHSMSAVVAHGLGSHSVVSGEREFHDGKPKINQMPVSLQAYAEIRDAFGVTHLLPVRFAKEGTEIEEVLQQQWAEGERQFPCVFSGNYTSVDGQNMVREEQIRAYFNEFGLPVAKEILKARLRGEEQDLDRDIATLARQLFERRGNVECLM